MKQYRLVMIRNNGMTVTDQSSDPRTLIDVAAQYCKDAAGTDTSIHFGRIIISDGKYLTFYSVQEIYGLNNERNKGCSRFRV